MRLSFLATTLALATSAFGQQKPTTDAGDDLLWKKLDARVGEIASRLDGVMGVAILDLTDGRFLLRNADKVFPTASSIKIAIVLELYRQHQEAAAGNAGKAKLDDIYTFDAKDVVDESLILAGLTPGVTRLTNRDLAQCVIAVSDNTASNILHDRVGGENVNATLRKLGLSKIMLRRKMMDIAAARRGDENVATPREMALLLQAIYTGKVLKKELNAEFIKQLSVTKKSYIPPSLPDGIQVANKPGDLQGVRNDSGIIFVPNRPFAISVMTAWNHDDRAAELAIGEVGLEAYHYFEMRATASEYGRIMPKE